jgi:hypothetical protein
MTSTNLSIPLLYRVCVGREREGGEKRGEKRGKKREGEREERERGESFVTIPIRKAGTS